MFLFGGSDVEAAAALLHDAVEDGGGETGLADISSACGDEVAAIVAACSDSTTDTTAGARKDPWVARKRRYLMHLGEPTIPRGAVLVSACDKLHNLTATRADYAMVGEELWGRFKTGWAGQVWLYRSLLEVYKDSQDPRVAPVAVRLGFELELLEHALCVHGHDLSNLGDRLGDDR